MKWNNLIPPNLSFKFQQLLHASTTLIERMLEQNAKLPHRPIHNDPILKISHWQLVNLYELNTFLLKLGSNHTNPTLKD